MLRVTIYTEETLKSAGEGSLSDVHEPLELEANYVSLINNSTYGPPPLVAPTKQEPSPVAKVGDTVVYVNTDRVPACEITRISE